MSIKTTPFEHCQPCDKRAYADERQADKARGRTNAKAARRNSANGSRRTMNEKRGRFYECPEGNGLHITSMSRQSFNEFMAADLLKMAG